MKDSGMYHPKGELQGDTADLPSKGTGVGHSGADEHLDGTSLGVDDTNSMGKITGSTHSDGKEGA